MKAVGINFGIVLLLLSYAVAQNAAPTATVQSITYARQGTDLRIEVTLSAPVKPSIQSAVNPDRILLDLPGTVCTDQTQAVEVGANGVRRVRTAQHSTEPMIARVVVDMDQAHPYSFKSEGNRIVLIVSPALAAVRSGAPVAAKSGSLTGIFRRKPRAPQVIEETAPSPVESVPPDTTAKLGPYIPPSLSGSTPWFPSAHTDTQSASAPAAASAPPAPFGSSSAAEKNSPAGSVAPESFPQAQIAANPVPSGSSTDTSTFSHTVPLAASTRDANPAPSISEPQGSSAVPSSSQAAASAGLGNPTSSSTVGPDASVAPPPKPADTVNPVAAAEPPAPQPPAGEVQSTVPASPAVEQTPAIQNAANHNAVPETAAPQTMISQSNDPGLRTVFKVKYVAEGVAYLEGGKAQGLTEGMKLVVEDSNLPAKQGDSGDASDPRVVAELEVSAVADTSAVTDIHSPKRPVKVGDLAYLSVSDTAALVEQRALSATRQYPAVISFTEDDTLDEEARAEVPRPPLPSVNRARGRIGFDSIDTISHGTTSLTSSDVGLVFRGDITRIGGTYWNLSGYWRGRLTKTSAASQQTLQNLINRTYHLSLTYDNPNSRLVAGFGRLYLPWAPSLDTIDGGYFGFKPANHTTLGIFGGSTPDPSSWNYTPNRVIGGAFVNFEGGEYNALHYTSTTGAGLSMVQWQTDRPFLFFEDSVNYGRTIGVYESAQFDNPRGNAAAPSPGAGLGRSFFTMRLQPHPRVELDFNHNYFRDIPTFDSTLIGTGLLDKFLFQGFSAGARVEVAKQIWISTNMGRSSRTGDATSSLNEMFGLTFGKLPWIDVRADAHYARFNSSFGSGSYEALTLSRQLSESWRIEALAGQQAFTSVVTTNGNARFFTGTVETTLGSHYYLQGNFTTNHSQLNYQQFMFSLGYRFDSRQHRK